MKEKDKLNHGKARRITEVKAKDRHEFHGFTRKD